MEGPASLRAPEGGPGGLLLDARLRVAVLETADRGWDVDLNMYEFRILDSQERELLVYHWQPGSDFRGPDQPHLHVSAALHARINAVTARL